MLSFDSENRAKKLKYPLFLTGITAAAGIGYLFYRSVHSKSGADFELSREQVKSILKEFRKDFYPIFKYLTNLSLTIQNDYKKKFNYIPDNIKNNLGVMLIDENPTFKEQVYSMEDRIYSKFGIHNRSGFEAYVLNLVKIDIEIQSVVNEIKNEFRKAVMGVSVTENITLPDMINPDLILQVYKDSLKLVLKRILSFVADYKERHGEINAYDENFAMQLKDLNLEKMKLEVLEEKGLGNFEDHHPEKIFYYALSKYSKENQGFKDRLVKMEVFHQTLTQKLFAPNADVKSLQIELEDLDQLVEVEEFILKESKEEWEDINDPLDRIDARTDVIENMAIDDNINNDVIITEKTKDHTKITYLQNNKIIEQIEETHTQNISANDEESFIQGPTEKTEHEEQKDESIPFQDTINKESEILFENQQIILISTHQEKVNLDFSKIGEPVVEIIENDDFKTNEPELKPVSTENLEVRQEVTVETPKLEF